ncbi:MAG: hypothetical protein HYW34_00875 [Candidatus Brennerbacteria bacterium]|nr:hypothetical protein [Candidatus Brennerbacteria bacterium]
MRFLKALLILSGVGATVFLLRMPFLFFWQKTNDVILSVNSAELDKKISPDILPKPEDIENQQPLPNPPAEIKAVYATSFSVSSRTKMKYLLELLKTTELNAIVIDIKTFDGYVAYDIKNDLIDKYKAKEIRISKINSLVKKLHDDNIYIIARIAVFQDPVLATARPDLAIHQYSKLPKEFMASSSSWPWSTSTLWYDNKKLAWIDPAAKEAWDYNIAIAKDLVERGFDEINFDYIRFASDGDLKNMTFPFYNRKTTLKSRIIGDFFQYLRSEMKDVKISADLFGLTTINKDDMGIGQIIENAYANFDYVAPMVYPSHYISGFLGYKNPALFPYEVVKYSMDNALSRLITYNRQLITASTTVKGQLSKVKLRPWLQDFDLGASYNADKIKKEIKAVYDSASSTAELLNGWMLWNASNVYTKEALTNL